MIQPSIQPIIQSIIPSTTQLKIPLTTQSIILIIQPSMQLSIQPSMQLSIQPSTIQLIIPSTIQLKISLTLQSIILIMQSLMQQQFNNYNENINLILQQLDSNIKSIEDYNKNNNEQYISNSYYKSLIDELDYKKSIIFNEIKKLNTDIQSHNQK